MSEVCGCLDELISQTEHCERCHRMPQIGPRRSFGLRNVEMARDWINQRFFYQIGLSPLLSVGPS
jgi:hypothetical protein